MDGAMAASRVRVLLSRELRDLLRHFTTLLPVVLVTFLSLVMPFGIAVIIPMLTGKGLGEDADLAKISAVSDAARALSPDARVQFFLFQQFLLLFLVTPITGAMTIAAHSVVGEKQARTLEPLLATPITTAELLVVKVLGALLPTLAITAVGLVVFFVGIAALGEAGVAAAMLSARTAVLLLFDGPAVALVALQAAILISSRVNDARTAQQFGVLIIIPLTAILVAQFTGSIWLTAATLAMVGAGLLVFWLLLTLLSVVVFDREAILTRWS
jgi:ABC-2 type transport system permease protein